MNTVLDSKRDSILSIAAKHGAKEIKVFGSFARGEDKLGSDVDIIVDLEEGRSLFDLIALKNDLEELLGRKVDVVTEDSVHWYIKEKIIQEAIEI
jgi:hypothetical protein